MQCRFCYKYETKVTLFEGVLAYESAVKEQEDFFRLEALVPESCRYLVVCHARLVKENELPLFQYEHL